MKIKLVLEYSGEGFSGWQRQQDQRTIQGEIESAIRIFIRSQRKILGLAETEQFPDVTGSGRTDAGVHALGQVASFVWPEELPADCYRMYSALNGILPPEIVVKEITPQPDAFDARFSRHVKRYSYHLLLRSVGTGFYRERAWCVGQLDIARMAEAARVLVGQHDFSSFRAIDCAATSTERTILVSEISRVSAEEVIYVAHGKGFLKQMIRIIVGTLTEIGAGRLTVADLQRILAAKDRSLAGPTAPARGLVLDWVRYTE